MMIEYQQLLNNGVLGVIVAWFMFRMEKLIKNNTTALTKVLDCLIIIELKGGKKK